MSTTAQAVAFLLLVTTFTAFLVQPGLAQQQTIPGLFPPGTPIDIMQCWSSIMSSQGCAFEIYKSLFSGQFGNIGSACCQAILSLMENCWTKMFPISPNFPPTLKDSCSQGGGVAPSAL